RLPGPAQGDVAGQRAARRGRALPPRDRGRDQGLREARAGRRGALPRVLANPQPHSFDRTPTAAYSTRLGGSGDDGGQGIALTARTTPTSAESRAPLCDLRESDIASLAVGPQCSREDAVAHRRLLDRRTPDWAVHVLAVRQLVEKGRPHLQDCVREPELEDAAGDRDRKSRVERKR